MNLMYQLTMFVFYIAEQWDLDANKYSMFLSLLKISGHPVMWDDKKVYWMTSFLINEKATWLLEDKRKDNPAKLENVW